MSLEYNDTLLHSSRALTLQLARYRPGNEAADGMPASYAASMSPLWIIRNVSVTIGMQTREKGSILNFGTLTP